MAIGVEQMIVKQIGIAQHKILIAFAEIGEGSLCPPV